MAWTTAKKAIVAGVWVLLASGAATMSLAQTQGQDELTPRQIIKKSQEVYAALSSYADDGKVVSSVGTQTVAPHTFTIKLARPNLYRIEWDQDSGFFDQKGVVWSAGSGDFLKMGEHSAEKCANKDGALAGATGISGRASASIPGTFFKMNWGNQFDASMQGAERKGDEKAGGVDCYVLKAEKGGRTRKLWIGKQDFLIHQVEDDTDAKVLKAVLEAAAKGHPELEASLNYVAGDSKSIQTHMHIVLNKSFSTADFDGQTSDEAKH